MQSKLLLFLAITLVLCAFYTFTRSIKKQNQPKLTGTVIRKDNERYEKSRLVSNYYTSKDKFPKLIVYCQNTQDVQNAVLYARSHKIAIRVRSGGHHHEGYSTGTDALIIDVSEMKNLQINKKTRIATAQPGLTNLELYSNLFEHSLTHVGGTCSDVALSGLVLSGGMGPLVRRVGLSCDSLVAFDMVDANGKIIHATKDNKHKDLFWATQGGGGGNFGIIVSLDINVYPVSQVTWFNIGWDWDAPVAKIIESWQNFFERQEIKWFSHLDIWGKKFPAKKLHKKPIKALGFFWGTPEDARTQLAPLLTLGKPSVILKQVNWSEAIRSIEESTAVFITDKPEYKSSGAFARKKLPAEAIAIMVKTLEHSPSQLLNVLLFSMGGAAAKVAPTATAYFYRDALFFINYTTQWLNSKEDQKHKTELKMLREKLMPYTVGDYIGNPDPDLNNYLRDYYGSNADKLIRIKQKYDPENIFKFEQSIPVLNK